MHALSKINIEDGIWKSLRHSQTAAAPKEKAKLQISRSLQDKPKRANKATSVWVPENRLRRGLEGGDKQGVTDSLFV